MFEISASRWIIAAWLIPLYDEVLKKFLAILKKVNLGFSTNIRHFLDCIGIVSLMLNSHKITGAGELII